MSGLQLVYSDDYTLPIGEHIFSGQKYRLLYQLLLGQGFAKPEDLLAPNPATMEDVLLVHTEEWVRKLRTATLTSAEELLLEIPFSPAAVQAYWRHAGGSILAARQALAGGICMNLGGGFHHAFADHGEGFCMINDIAIAIRRLFRDGQASRAMVIDCDVHQGNGTAAIFNPAATPPPPPDNFWPAPAYRSLQSTSVREADFGDVFTLSLHQENNYPFWKPPSSLDINLPDGTDDAEYLHWLDNALSTAFRQFAPDLIAYVAGADPYREDQLGGLSLTMEGLQQRDELVFSWARQRRIPVFVTLAGGYARRTEDTIRIHANTVRAANEIFSR